MTSPNEIGTLIAVILKAKNLPNKRHIGKQDPYCCASLNGEKRKTRAIKRGGQHPEWDEEVRFSLLEDLSDEAEIPTIEGEEPPPLPPKDGKGPKRILGGTLMKLQCFADDPREPDLIGETMVDLTEVLTKGETDEWFTLMNKDKYCGEVYLELTFWSNEKPPEKKTRPKPTKPNKQYAGPGTFVPSWESTTSIPVPSSLMSGGSKLSRISTTDSDSLPSSLRSSNSGARLDLYSAPYEQRSRYSSDALANDFGELNVSDHRRRESFPPHHGHTPRPSSSTGFSTISTHPLNGFEPSTYSNGGSQYGYDRPVTPTQLLHHRATVSGAHSHSGQSPYQPHYEMSTSPSGYPPSRSPTRQSSGPRYSLPAASSGFMPIPTPGPSGFMPLGSHSHDPSGFAPPPAQTPTLMNYGIPQLPPQSGFAPMPAQTPVPSGFMQPSHQQAYLPNHHPQPQSFQYPQYPQHPPPAAPPQQYPPASAPSSQQYIPPPTPASISPHSHSAPPQGFPEYSHTSPSPPHDYISPPLQNNSLSSSQSVGSRPLPQPQGFAHQPSQRKPSLPVPPSGSQPYPATQPGSIVFPSANPYGSVPPPPPPPPQLNHQRSTSQLAHQRTTSQSYHSPTIPVPPPPPPPLSQIHSSSPSGRPSLPQPPVGYHQQQQPIYQPVPPPPPSDFALHIQPPPPPPPRPTGNQSYYPDSAQSQWMPSDSYPNGHYSPLPSQSGQA